MCSAPGKECKPVAARLAYSCIKKRRSSFVRLSGNALPE
ncbi:hypothetical protein LEMLEM_LOCUS7541 [Lemmus lemmus]